MTQKAEVGEVWFSLEAGKFFQIRGVHDDWFLCGGFCDYYEDSMTNTLKQRLSPQYLQEKAMLVPGAIAHLIGLPPGFWRRVRRFLMPGYPWIGRWQMETAIAEAEPSQEAKL